IYFAHILGKFLERNTGVGNKIYLVENDGISLVKHQRIFLRFFCTFGRAVNHDLQILAEIKLSWANEIADVLDKQNVKAFHIETVKSVMHHPCVEVANESGRYLISGNARCGHTV